VPIVILGAGFSPNIFLHYAAAGGGGGGHCPQFAMMKNMGSKPPAEGTSARDFFESGDAAGL